MNQVMFDAGNEHFAVLATCDPCGDDFKLLGAFVDPKLLMVAKIDRILNKARPQIRAILEQKQFIMSVR